MPVSPQQKGRDHEARYSGRWGLNLVPGSGATPRAMLDVGKGKLIVSLKHTIHSSIRVTADMLREARAGAYGPRARSTDMIPAFSFHLEEDGEDWTALPTDVLMAIIAGEIKLEQPSVSIRAQRRAAALPPALRD